MHFASRVLAGTAFVLTAFAAQADQVRNAEFEFSSGATFSGTLTFLDDFSNVVAVTGTLQGGSVASPEALTWIWEDNPSLNYESNAGGPGFAHNFLMSGSRSGPGNGNGTWGTFISFNWNYSDVNHILVTPIPGTTDVFSNNISYTDPMVSGSITAVPEPETYAMLLAGLGVLGFMGKRRRAS